MAEIWNTLQRPACTAEQVDAFEATLVRSLLPHSCAFLGVDYGPDGRLRAALVAAGIPVSSALPWKSGVRIEEDGRVFAKCGYGAPEEEL